jgi:membrane protein involved in colicin uptake
LDAEKEFAHRAEEAKAKALIERERAVEAERKRITDEQRREAEESEKRARNRAHQASVNREILAALALLNISGDAGKLIIAAIVKGAIPHVSINY